MRFFLETHNGKCSVFGGHFYDQEKGSAAVSSCHPESVLTWKSEPRRRASKGEVLS